MTSPLKNINKEKVLRLKEELTYQQGQIVSKTLVQNDAISITLFSFFKGLNLQFKCNTKKSGT